MPPDIEPTALHRADRVRAASEDLRDLSSRILAELDALRQLEAESRKLRVGSEEFKLISAEIAARSKAIFNMTVEQQSIGEVVPPQNETLEDLDEATG